jgi:hypothetical protein
VWIGYIEAHGGGRNTRSRDFEAEVSSSAPAAPPVRGLDVCTPGPECDYGAAYDSFLTWGNVYPNTLGDCSFAAAANWEQIVLGIHANETVLGFEFAQAGGTAERGLAQNALWTYWQKNGIYGVYLKSLDRFTPSKANVENGVRDYAAMMVELSFTANDYFAQYLIPVANTHEAVVDGFTPEGPLVTTWGETLQMTWEQWNDEVIGMWGIGAS